MANNLKINKILKEQLLKIKPTKQEIAEISKETAEIIKELNKNIKSKKIKADVFIGGSLAKETLIKKQEYDIDIFVRFDDKYKEEELSKLLEKIIKIRKFKNIKKIHGSRDYFQIKGKKEMIFEIIPTIKISKPEKARNVTDLSYFHVKYVKSKINKIKNKRLSEEIMLAKCFCFAQNCYGAESYIHGFSGYALELLVIHYKGFLNFIKKIESAKKEKQIIIDSGKFYKNEKQIKWELNESKLQSPIVFVDPTFKERNALAALSKETFFKFQNTCEKFLKNPSRNFFEPRKINENKFNLILEVQTSKQEGDIAGSKLKKFYEFFSRELGKYFDIKSREFKYSGGKTARYYFNLKKKKQIIIQGPPVTKIHNLTQFKKKHKNAKIKSGRAYAVEKVKTTEKTFIEDFNRKNKKIMKEMGITGLKKV